MMSDNYKPRTTRRLHLIETVAMVLCLSYEDLRRHPDGIAAYARLVSRFADAFLSADDRFDPELFVKRCAEGRL